jgi:hypothetical protein
MWVFLNIITIGRKTGFIYSLIDNAPSSMESVHRNAEMKYVRNLMHVRLLCVRR